MQESNVRNGFLLFIISLNYSQLDIIMFSLVFFFHCDNWRIVWVLLPLEE